MRNVIIKEAIERAWFKVEPYNLDSMGYNFIASGSERAVKTFFNEGKMRVDGKLIVGQLINEGTIKIIGEIETEPIFL